MRKNLGNNISEKIIIKKLKEIFGKLILLKLIS
jgi:hypothetical protein